MEAALKKTAGVVDTFDGLTYAGTSLRLNVRRVDAQRLGFTAEDIASAVSTVEVRKLGFDGVVAQFAQTYSFLYGLLAIGIAVVMGWLAGRVFALV